MPILDPQGVPYAPSQPEPTPDQSPWQILQQEVRQGGAGFPVPRFTTTIIEAWAIQAIFERTTS